MIQRFGAGVGARRLALGMLWPALALGAVGAPSAVEAAGQCKILIGDAFRGYWVIEDGSRRIGYRLAPQAGSIFELRLEKSVAHPEGSFKIACPTCPPERSPIIETFAFGGASEDAYAPEKHPPSYRHELLNEEARAANTVTISEPIDIAIGPFKGWSVAIELVNKTVPAERMAFAYSYVSDGCLGGFFMLAFDPDAKGRWMPMGQMIDHLKAAIASFSIETFDPATDPQISAELKKLPR